MRGTADKATAGNGNQVATKYLEKKAPKGGKKVITIPALDIREATIRVVGVSSYIAHRWSVKAKGQMLAKHMKKADEPLPAKVPENDFRDCLYLDTKGNTCIPASAFKKAAVDACSFLDGITKVVARGSFYVMGDLIPIERVKPRMREDMVRIGMRKPDIRYRADHEEGWECKLRIRYNANVMSLDQIANLLNVAGFSIGVGDWRPQRDGSHGMFTVKEG